MHDAETALILVDLQNDFLPGGALPVPGGDEVIAVANQIMAAYSFVVATQDWHPQDHLSFASQHPGKRPGDHIVLEGLDQVLWPDHCVQGTWGAEFAADLATAGIHEVVRKGTLRRVDSYSGFFDNARRNATGLENLLRQRGVRAVHVMGLATDYCVLATCLDAAGLGFATTLVQDGSRGVNLVAGDVARAVEQMQRAGVQLV